MRIQRVIVLTAAVAFLILPAIRSTAQKTPGRSPDADWPMFNRDYAGHAVLAVDTDQHLERHQPEAGVDIQAAAARRQAADGVEPRAKFFRRSRRSL